MVLVLLISRVIVANYSKEVLNTNVSQKLVESVGRASNPPEFVSVNEWSRTVELSRGEVRTEVWERAE